MNKIAMIATAVSALFIANSAAACNEQEALALNMYHEARGQGPDAMQMVGEVTLNRVASDRHPNTICGVVYEARRDSRGNPIRHRCQFSWYCDGRSDRVSNNVIEQRAWVMAQEIAAGLLDGSIDTFDNGATHFLNPNKVSRMPRWTREFVRVGSIGEHVFYAEG